MIEPALSAQEWASLRLMDQMRPLTDKVLTHGMAALILHGQPFGFTWDMVDAIRAAEVVTYADDAGVDSDLEQGALLREAADRIAALLPPREPK